MTRRSFWQPDVQLTDSRGRSVQLGAELGRGGEGSVYALSDPTLVAKVYHRPADSERAAKLAAMARLSTDRLTLLAAWPIETLHDRPGGSMVGLLMPRATGYKAIHQLYGPKTRRIEFPRAGWPFCIHAAANVARAFAVVHEHGHVIGDVNHGNVVVSGRATAMLIDCDSFQVAAGPRSYLCDVGVSTHQPPELQTVPSFRGIVRTQNHDNFGLAVLIFQLLVMGRHPFAGTYLALGEMPIERAIQEFRFAYGPAAQSRQMKPPPNTLPFEALPSSVGRLFERAFAQEGARDGGRPLAREWVLALERLGERLKRCNRNQGHSYLDTLADCPWCAIESQTGVRLFAPTVTDPAHNRPGIDLNAAWNGILAVTGPGPAPRLPDWTTLTYRPSTRARHKGRIRKVRQAAAAVLALTGVALLAAGIPAPNLGAAPSLVGSAVVGATIYRGSGHARAAARKKLEEARARYDALAARWRREASDQAFRAKRRELERAREEYLALPAREQAAMRQVSTDPRYRQLRRFLDRQLLAAVKLPGVGFGREATLRSYGIETAADVTPEAIGAIPGFGTALTASLVEWRRSLERRFVFDPTRPEDPGDVDDLEEDLRATKARLEQLLRGGAAELQAIIQRVEDRRRELRAEIDRAQSELARADAEWRVS
jgi:DNA-binding helix-hairpin-helix protein with protein kinase domain